MGVKLRVCRLLAGPLVLALAGMAPAQVARVSARDRDLAGGILGLQGNFYSGSLNIFSGGPACGVFDRGSGWEPMFGLVAEFPLSRTLNLVPRFFGDDRSGVFKTTHGDDSVLVNSRPAPATVDHELAMTLRTLSAEVDVKWMPFARNNIFVQAGVSAALVFANHYRQTEQIVDPPNGVFAGTTTSGLVLADGTFTSIATVEPALLLGAGYDLPVSQRTFIAPELTGVFGLTNVVRNASWTIVSLRLLASVKTDVTSFLHGDETPAVESIPVVAPPPAAPAPPMPHAAMAIVGLTPDGDQMPHPTLRVEEFLSSELAPLLNQVYFDEGSADVPARYVRLRPEETDAFRDTMTMTSTTLAAYYQTLNLVGRRLRDHPAANLTIVGCNDNQGPERGDLELSRRRADAVRAYLADVWGIAAMRMTVKARNLPDQPSREGAAFGAEENRRVELLSDDPDVIAPVVQAGLERQASPPRVRLFTTTQNQELIARWSADVVSDGRVVATVGGAGAPPATHDWVLSALADTLIQGELPLTFRMTLVDSMGRTTTSETSIPLRALTLRKKREQHLADMRIDKFSLFLFDFDKSALTARSRAILDRVVQAIQPTSSVFVVGFTDSVGEVEHNRTLSQARAAVVADYLRAHATAVRVDAQGMGATTTLFDNATPEGRSFCRTTYVRIETPLQH